MPCATSAIGAYSPAKISSAALSAWRTPIFTTASVARVDAVVGPERVAGADHLDRRLGQRRVAGLRRCSRSVRAISASPARRALPAASMPENIAVVITR